MKILVAFVFSYLSVSAVSQEFAIQNTRENIAYAGIPCYLRCVVNGYPSKSVGLTADNGFIKNNGSGDFVFVSKEPGPAILTVWVLTLKAKKKIGTYPYRIHKPPPLKAMIGSSLGGYVTNTFLVAMGGVRATSFPDYCTESPVLIVSFSAKAFFNDSSVFTFGNAGPQWQASNITKLQTLRPGSTIVFYNILGRFYNGNMHKADDLTFTITDNLKK
ncbi:MAG: hypothetical protein V4722_12395 [Bacteroidota bacterium]